MSWVCFFLVHDLWNIVWWVVKIVRKFQYLSTYNPFFHFNLHRSHCNLFHQFREKKKWMNEYKSWEKSRYFRSRLSFLCEINARILNNIVLFYNFVPTIGHGIVIFKYSQCRMGGLYQTARSFCLFRSHGFHFLVYPSVDNLPVKIQKFSLDWFYIFWWNIFECHFKSCPSTVFGTCKVTYSERNG